MEFFYIKIASSCKIVMTLFNHYRVTRMHSADNAVVRCPSVCLSVRHTPVLCLNDYTYPQFFPLSGSPTIVVFRIKRDGNIPTGCRWTEASNARRYE